jgi:DNA-binding response OmpR family regulator
MVKENIVTKTILVVDDERYIQKLLEETLEQFTNKGVRLLMADDGSKGLELTLAYHPDIIFLDVRMPKMNGYDVCEIIKKKYNLQHTYVVMLTSKGQQIDEEKAYSVGADEYMSKPFDPDEIVRKTSEILGI